MAKKKEETIAEIPAVQQAEAKPGYHIVAMQVDNIKRVTCVRIRPKNNMVILAGENESGKSSVLDAIDMALGGTTKIPSRPIKDGARTASIRINFGEFEVLRTFTKVEGGKDPYLTKLQIFGKNNTRYDKPQALLDGFMGAISFDPLEFIRMAPSKQLETLRGLVNFNADIDAIQAEKDEAYAQRRIIGRDVENAQARLNSTPKPAEGLPEVAIDTEALTRTLETAATHNSERAQQIAKLDRMKQEAENHINKAQVALSEAFNLRDRAAQLEDDAKVHGQTAERIAEAVATSVIPEELIVSDIASELSAANLTNAAIQQRNLYVKLEAELAETEGTWKALDNTVKAKQIERANAIASAKMPIEGLSIGEGEVIYNGIPFEQASNAVQIKTSVALAIASNPTLRVLRIKDGSLLDQKSLAIVNQMAEAGGYQIWMEVVNASGKVSVTMENGEASGEDVEEPFRETDKLSKK